MGGLLKPIILAVAKKLELRIDKGVGKASNSVDSYIRIYIWSSSYTKKTYAQTIIICLFNIGVGGSIMIILFAMETK